MKITYRALKRAGACSKQLQDFKERFGASTDVTEAACVAVASAFNWGWAANNLLDKNAKKAYDEAIAPAWKAYDEAIAPAWKAYDEAIAPAKKAYDEAKASAFSRAYNSQHH